MRTRLSEMDTNELRGALLTLAKAISFQDREQFLQMLEQDEPHVDDDAAALRDELLLFRRDVQAGVFRSQHLGRHARAWYDVLERLLSMANEVMEQGQRELAREVYAEALATFRLPWYQLGEVRQPWERLNIDISVIKARYLRLTLEQVLSAAGNDAERLTGARRLLEAFFFAIPTGTEQVDLHWVMEEERLPFPKIGEFLPYWLLALIGSERSFVRHRRGIWNALLSEAWQLAGKQPDMEERILLLAEDHPRLLVEWIKNQAHRRTWAKAMKIADDGLEVVTDPTSRLILAVALGHLALRGKKPDLALKGVRTAWRLCPSLERFHALCVVGDPRPAALDSRLVDELEAFEGGGVELDAALLGLLEVMVGDYSTPTELLDDVDPTILPDASKPFIRILPVLLMVAAGPEALPKGSVIKELWLVSSQSSHRCHQLASQKWRRAEEEANRLARLLSPRGKRSARGSLEERFGSLIQRAIARHPPTLKNAAAACRRRSGWSGSSSISSFDTRSERITTMSPACS